MINSQLPVKEWHGYIGEPTMTDAVMNRLTATNHRLELKLTLSPPVYQHNTCYNKKE